MLDSDYVNRAAPPGSMHYFALLYTPAEQRELLTALFVIEAEIRASANAAHDVAHTRLQWWRAEIDRLINRNAQHPATQIVQATRATADFSVLHELLVAADMDLACMTYNTPEELNGYLERSGGTIFELFASDPDSRRAGAFVRRVETLRDLVMDARSGRIYWPLDELGSMNVDVQSLRSASASDAARALIAAECSRLQSMPTPAIVRPLAVLLQLHRRLLTRIARAEHDVFSQRHELGPFEKSWTAWRAARRS